MNKTLLMLTIFCGLLPSVKAQDSIRPAVFTNKYWGYVCNESKSLNQQYDTLFLIRKNDKEDLFKGQLKGGVIFCEDGSFESFNY